LANVFDVNLRYAPIAFGSRSFILDQVFFTPMAIDRKVDALSATAGHAGANTGLYPLYSVGVERSAKWKFEYGVQLLLVGIMQFIEVMRARYAVGRNSGPSLPEKSTSLASISGNNKPSSQPQPSTHLQIQDVLSRLKLLFSDLRLYPPLESVFKSGNRN
jgi:hypothetical protein